MVGNVSKINSFATFRSFNYETLPITKKKTSQLRVLLEQSKLSIC